MIQILVLSKKESFSLNFGLKQSFLKSKLKYKLFVLKNILQHSICIELNTQNLLSSYCKGMENGRV